MRFKTVSQHWKSHHHLNLPLRAHTRRSLTTSWCWHRINRRWQHIPPICFLHLWGRRTVFQTRDYPIFMSAANPLTGRVLYCCKVAVPRMALLDFPASRPSAVCEASVSPSCCVHFSGWCHAITYPARCFRNLFISTLKSCKDQVLALKELTPCTVKIGSYFFSEFWMIGLKIMLQLTYCYNAIQKCSVASDIIR